MRFYKNTDNVDIANKCVGISNDAQLDDRGLSISIRHNGHAGVYRTAWNIQEKIVNMLNGTQESELAEALRALVERIDELKIGDVAVKDKLCAELAKADYVLKKQLNK